MKVYPRANEIPAGYTGCQVVWLQRNGAWILFSTRYYSGGALRAFIRRGKQAGPEFGARLRHHGRAANDGVL